MKMRYRWFAEGKDESLDEYGIKKTREPIFPPQEETMADRSDKLFSRGEISGICLSIFVLSYGVFTADLPIVFLSVSFLIYVLRPLTFYLGAKKGHFISNLMQGFSIALFLGAMLMAFL